MILCHVCGNEFEEDEIFVCSKCGEDTCKSCGNPVEKLCDYCITVPQEDDNLDSFDAEGEEEYEEYGY